MFPVIWSQAVVTVREKVETRTGRVSSHSFRGAVTVAQLPRFTLMTASLSSDLESQGHYLPLCGSFCQEEQHTTADLSLNSQMYLEKMQIK